MRREPAIPLEDIADHIVIVRGQRVLLDGDLARLYGVMSKRLNEQVKRNSLRFPADFVFRLKDHELTDLRSQFATSSSSVRSWGGRRYAPYAFTEHGALMAANVLNSVRAIAVSVFVVRAFIQLRRTLAAHKDLAEKLQELERKTEALALKHNEFAAEARAQFKDVIEALRRLMSAPIPPRRPIGFVMPK